MPLRAVCSGCGRVILKVDEPPARLEDLLCEPPASCPACGRRLNWSKPKVEVRAGGALLEGSTGTPNHPLKPARGGKIPGAAAGVASKARRGKARAIINIIDRLEREAGQPAPKPLVMEEAERMGIGRDEAEAIMALLLREEGSRLFQPKPGHYSILR